MNSTDQVGLLAGALTTLAFVPQVLKIWKSKQANDISLATFAIFSSGVALWLVYGLRIASWPIILANSVTLALALLILILKWYFVLRKKRVEHVKNNT